jgi:hypothetical protein
MPREVVTEFYIGQGIVLIAEVDTNGNPLGFEDFGDVPELTTSLDVSYLEVPESRSGQRLLVLRTETEKKSTFSFTAHNLNSANLAKALRAQLSDIAAGNVPAESVTARLGKIVPLENIKVSSVVVKGTGTNSAITYVAGENYTVNLDSGSLYFMTAAEQTAADADNSIADAAVLAVDYSRAAQTKLEAFAVAEREFALRFEGLNIARSNDPVILTIPRIRLSPAKTLSLINKEQATLALEGAALVPLSCGSPIILQKL